MSIFTHIPAPTSSFPKIRTWNTTVMILPRISSSSIFPWMNKGALSPIMGIGTRTRSHLEGIHSEFIG
uniref:Uncharacterized protein MANES_08G048800 n=1 Tax=Rhizophora mucronata TaxID=61149 RepID=A0A2P2MJU4_RHIMU